VQEIVDIPLPRPRDQVETKEIPEFAQLRGYVWRSIKRPETTDVPA
jgi:NitT/TauT family transport system ATP-binding protein